jgi:hypothetical protein
MIPFIPYKKFGRAVRFSEAEILGWTKSKDAGAGQPQLNGVEGGGK